MVKRVPVTDLVSDSGIVIKPSKTSKVAAIELEAEHSGLSNLRLLAKMRYISSPDSISIEALHREEPFNRVNLKTFNTWSYKDGWVNARIDYRANLEREVLKNIGEAQVRAIAKQLKSLEMVSQRLYSLIESGGVLPNSLEGLVNALVRLETFRFEAIDKAARVTSGVVGDNTSRPKFKYNKESIRKAAISIIKSDMSSRVNREKVD